MGSFDAIHEVQKRSFGNFDEKNTIIAGVRDQDGKLTNFIQFMLGNAEHLEMSSKGNKSW